jgi:hypothetical protein
MQGVAQAGPSCSVFPCHSELPGPHQLLLVGPGILCEAFYKLEVP